MSVVGHPTYHTARGVDIRNNGGNGAETETVEASSKSPPPSPSPTDARVRAPTRRVVPIPADVPTVPTARGASPIARCTGGTRFIIRNETHRCAVCTFCPNPATVARRPRIGIRAIDVEGITFIIVVVVVVAITGPTVSVRASHGSIGETTSDDGNERTNEH
jgi:hypothetical protein